jgi:hypothetical protein
MRAAMGRRRSVLRAPASVSVHSRVRVRARARAWLAHGVEARCVAAWQQPVSPQPTPNQPTNQHPSTTAQPPPTANRRRERVVHQPHGGHEQGRHGRHPSRAAAALPRVRRGRDLRAHPGTRVRAYMTRGVCACVQDTQRVRVWLGQSVVLSHRPARLRPPPPLASSPLALSLAHRPPSLPLPPARPSPAPPPLPPSPPGAAHAQHARPGPQPPARRAADQHGASPRAAGLPCGCGTRTHTHTHRHAHACRRRHAAGAVRRVAKAGRRGDASVLGLNARTSPLAHHPHTTLTRPSIPASRPLLLQAMFWSSPRGPTGRRG